MCLVCLVCREQTRASRHTHIHSSETPRAPIQRLAQLSAWSNGDLVTVAAVSSCPKWGNCSNGSVGHGDGCAGERVGGARECNGQLRQKVIAQNKQNKEI